MAFVAVTGFRRQIWARLLSGGAPLAITNDDTDPFGPGWSADSSSLIYYTPGKQTGESGTIWEVPALGGSRRKLVNALGPGDLSHDGKKLAFFRFREGAIELAVASRDLSYTRRVTKVQGPSLYGPRWSTDDQRIAYLSHLGSATFSASLMVTDASGGMPRVVSSEFDFQGFTWAPDGSGLIVSSARGSSMPYPPTFNLWFLPWGPVHRGNSPLANLPTSHQTFLRPGRYLQVGYARIRIYGNSQPPVSRVRTCSTV